MFSLFAGGIEPWLFHVAQALIGSTAIGLCVYVLDGYWIKRRVPKDIDDAGGFEK